MVMLYTNGKMCLVQEKHLFNECHKNSSWSSASGVIRLCAVFQVSDKFLCAFCKDVGWKVQKMKWALQRESLKIELGGY